MSISRLKPSALTVVSGSLALVVAIGPVALAADKKPAAKSDVVVVKAEGEGIDKEQAVKAALRDALEKGGKQEIFSDTKVKRSTSTPARERYLIK